MFVHLRAPGGGASVALLAIAAVAAALYFTPWRRGVAAPPAAPAEPTESTAQTAPADGILRIGLESPFVHDAGDGIVHLGVRVTPPVDAAAERAPVAIALVIDSSGSMDGLKMDHARFAARTVVERLREGDRVVVIDFDDTARAVVPLTTLGPDRSAILAAIDGMQAGGGTALHVGVEGGIAAVKAAGTTRRLILISDGQATVGPSTPDAIAGLDPAGTTLSAIGVGTDYDEKMMLAVADHGRGGFHHLADPIQLADILDAELKSARAVAGRDATIDLRPADGVTLLAVAGHGPQPVGDGVWRVPLGDLYAGESRSLTVRMKVPTERVHLPFVDVHRRVGAVSLSYRPIEGAASVDRQAEAHYVLTPSADDVRAGLQPRWMVAADRMRVSHVLVDAAALLRGGDLLEAQAILRDERARLQSRRARTDGTTRDELDALIALLADPYVDARLDAPQAAPADVDARFDAALETIRRGDAIAAADLAGFDAERLRILRNGAYARHGYRFKSSELQRFFASTGWYTADAGFDPSRLSKADVANVALIKQHEGGAAIAAAAPVTPSAVGDFDAVFERVRRGQAVDGPSLDGLGLVELRRLRNAAYARHGYAFRAQDLQTFFARRAWYAADPAYDPSRLTPTDGANIRLIKAREQTVVARAGGSAVRDFELRSRAKARQALR